MKTKLLKKIRKRFDWYINIDGFPILIDHKEKTVKIIDTNAAILYWRLNSNYVPEVSEQEWTWRNMKQRMYKTFGFSMERVWYNKFTRASKRRKKNSKN